MSGTAFIKFYGADWRSDPALRLCSEAARGVWIDLITLMMEAEPYGQLLINSAPPSIEQLAKLLHCRVKILRASIDELTRNGVASVTESGIIYNRRLVRDRQKSEQGRVFGKSGGNPALKADRQEPKQGGLRVWDKGTLKAEGYGEGLTPTLNPSLVIPDARYQIPESPPIIPPDQTGQNERIEAKSMDFALGDYVFAGKVIRLNRADFETWKARYHAIPDLMAELGALDDWLSGQPEAKRKAWFHTVSGALGRKHQERLSAGAKADSRGKGEDEAFVAGPPWRQRLARWKRGNGWLDLWGPTPDQPGCHVPAELLREYREWRDSQRAMSHQPMAG